MYTLYVNVDSLMIYIILNNTLGNVDTNVMQVHVSCIQMFIAAVLSAFWSDRKQTYSS